jgi:hypothetical protein
MNSQDFMKVSTACHMKHIIHMPIFIPIVVASSIHRVAFTGGRELDMVLYK